MAITDMERKEIKKSAKFLEKLGYTMTEDAYSINYSLNNICFSIVYPPNSEESDINIRFIDKNQVFSIGWIALVRENINGNNDKFMNVKELLKYVKNHHLQIKDYQYCVESYKLVDKYVEEHWEKYKSSIYNFLSKN